MSRESELLAVLLALVGLYAALGWLIARIRARGKR
jgi:hypothetical protein